MRIVIGGNFSDDNARIKETSPGLFSVSKNFRKKLNILLKEHFPNSSPLMTVNYEDHGLGGAHEVVWETEVNFRLGKYFPAE